MIGFDTSGFVIHAFYRMNSINGAAELCAAGVQQGAV